MSAVKTVSCMPIETVWTLALHLTDMLDCNVHHYLTKFETGLRSFLYPQQKFNDI